MALDADVRPDLLRVVVTHEDEPSASHAVLVEFWIASYA